MSELIFSCPDTQRTFNSGFRATQADLEQIPPGKMMRLRCPICGKSHDCDFASAGLCRSPNFCRDRKNCRFCSFAAFEV